MDKEKIVAAIDGSDYSVKVLDTAINLARQRDGEIYLVYCHRRYPRLLGQPQLDQIISAINDQTEETIKPFIERLKKSGVTFHERLMEEPAGTMIPLVAETEGCSLIVMGSRGLSNLEGLLIGSVTHKVLHTARCSVLVVK